MRNASRRTIRQFIALWLGAVWISFALLGGGLLAVVPRLNDKTQREYADSRTLDENRRFEMALTAQERDELQWRLNVAVRPQSLQRPPTLALRETDAALAALQNGEAYASATATEAQVLKNIVQAYTPVRALALSPSHDTAKMQAALDRLLPLVRQHRVINAQQMAATLRSGDRLDTWIDHWTLALLLGATSLIVAGSLILWSRLFTPLLRLADAVEKFGDGDLQVRASVLRNDEMGHVAETFNGMAEAISERERDRLRFVATVVHDLRNPLVVIGGAAHLLKNKEMKLTPGERAEWLINIVKNTSRLEAMIGDLMDGVQAETGQLRFDFQEVDLSALTREIIDDYTTTTQTHLLRHDIVETCNVRGDHKRLERVLANLISNAIKYSPAGHEVHISLAVRDTQAVWTVRDEGEGMAPEDLHLLFQPFLRLERTRKMASGTGLGLSSVKKIVEGHGGTIDVQSVLGEGTSVEIRLPNTEGGKGA